MRFSETGTILLPLSGTPIGPRGSGGTAPSSSSLLLAMNEHWLFVAPRIRHRCAPKDGNPIPETEHSPSTKPIVNFSPVRPVGFEISARNQRTS